MAKQINIPHKIKIFQGDPVQIEKDFNEWAQGKQIISVQPALAAAACSIPGSSLVTPTPKLNIANFQALVIVVLYE